MGKRIGKKQAFINKEIDINALKQTLQSIDNKRVRDVAKLAKSYLRIKPSLGTEGEESYESNLEFTNKGGVLTADIAGMKVQIPAIKAIDPDGDVVMVPDLQNGIEEYFNTVGELSNLLSTLLKTETMFRALIEQLTPAGTYVPKDKPYYGKTFIELLNTPGVGDVIRFEQGSLIDTLKKTSDTAKYISSILRGESIEEPVDDVDVLEVPMFGRKGRGYSPTSVENYREDNAPASGFNEPFTGRQILK